MKLLLKFIWKVFLFCMIICAVVGQYNKGGWHIAIAFLLVILAAKFIFEIDKIFED